MPNAVRRMRCSPVFRPCPTNGPSGTPAPTDAARNIAAISGGERLPCVRGAVERSETEGLPPQLRFPPLSNRCSPRQEYGSVLQVPSAGKTARPTENSGIDKAPVFAPDRSFSDSCKIQLRKQSFSHGFAVPAPFTQGSLFLLSAAFCFFAAWKPKHRRRAGRSGKILS